MRPVFSIALLIVACAGCLAGSGQGTGAPDGGPFGDDPDGATSADGSRTKESGADDDGGAYGPSDGGGDGGTTKDDDAIINLTFTGCSPVFNDVRVTTNVVAYDSLGVTSAFAPLNGGVQVALKDATPRSVVLSSTQRSQSSNSVVINVFAGGTTYTNFCNPSPTGCSFDAASNKWLNDPVSGTFQIKAYDPHQGKLDVVFTNVVVQAVSGSATCKVSGTLVTKRLSR
jgi:hypothetical protein